MYRCRLTRYNIIAYGSYGTVVVKSIPADAVDRRGRRLGTVGLRPTAPFRTVSAGLPALRGCAAAGWAAGRTAPSGIRHSGRTAAELSFSGYLGTRRANE
ncbi:unnamed protein product [Calypogeia fissa]